MGKILILFHYKNNNVKMQKFVKFYLVIFAKIRYRIRKKSHIMEEFIHLCLLRCSFDYVER